jgi:UDP-N-acetylmuramate--alanine ligase
LIGIAGAGVSALARVLHDWGWPVTGSDASLSPPSWLADAGIEVHRGHASAHVPADAELVVWSDAVEPGNPERQEALRRGIPGLSYFEAVGGLSRTHTTLAVAGTHGKSTTAAMLAFILTEAGLDPTVIGGGTPIGSESGGRGGHGRPMVVEACEYRANFLKLRPTAAAILNVEADHFDYYRSDEQMDRAFAEFAGCLPPEGLAVVAAACPRARRAAEAARCRVETFGLDGQADWNAVRVQGEAGYYRFEIRHFDRGLSVVRLQVPGIHNVRNALAAAALADYAGAGWDAIADGLSRFPGIRRRLERRGDWQGVRLLDDFAHHPTEVRAALGTVRQMYPGARLWCVFQPHQVSRTAALLDELAASLQNTDVALVAEIFRAREPVAQAGEVTAADLACRARARGGCVPAVHAVPEIARHLSESLRPGDVLVTLGAGDIGRLHEKFTEKS